MFADFFNNKIRKIREILPLVSPSDYLQSTHFCFESFEPVTCEYVIKLIKTSPSKSCVLDPIPTVLLKQCTDVIAPTIAHITNVSLMSGEFPKTCKSAIVRPLMKKCELDSNLLKNYRPVSNLSFLSKHIETSVSCQLNPFIPSSEQPICQMSVNREGRSTETALLKVLNDVLCSLDKRDDVILIMLDLSAAFDTIDHDILLHRLLHRLRHRFGIT